MDTFPLVQGHSQEEFFAKKNGVVINTKELVECGKTFPFNYEALKKINFTNTLRKEVFLKTFQIKKEDINENTTIYDLKLNLYKKINKNANFKNIQKCIEKLKNIPDCKEQFFKRINCLIRNKDYFEMEKETEYIEWKVDKEVKRKYNKFFEII
jgi:hypothetical protein